MTFTPISDSSTMGLQPRKTANGSVEPLLPAHNEQTYEDDEKIKKPRQSLPACKITLSQSGLVFFGILTFLALHRSLGYDLDLAFGFPYPKPTPVPGYVKEGIEQCKIISRPPPHFKKSDASRRESDRFVKGTRGVWLKNGTVWTGEKGGEEILSGVDVLLQGGVVRKIGKGEDWDDVVGDVEEVQLNGAWVTPGKWSFSPSPCFPLGHRK